MRVCHACQNTVDELMIGRRDECARCGADLHVCLNCRFYDETASRQCREPQSEPPREKNRSNFCDFFEFSEAGPRSSGPSAAEQAKAAFEALFKKK